MGQGCSTGTSRVDRIADPAVREIVDASLFTIDDLRRRAHQERFGDDNNCDAVIDLIKGTDTDTDSDTDTKRTCVAGQERLLFPNLPLLETKVLASPVPKTSDGGGPSQRPRGRGFSRKVSESFEAERKTKTMDIAVGGMPSPSPSSLESSTDSTVDANGIANVEASEAAVLEDFEVALSKEIGSVCPTRLWIARRPLSNKRRKLKLKLTMTFKTKAKQQKQQKKESCDTGMVLLEQGSCYHRDEDYFSGRSDRDCHQPQTATPEDNDNSNTTLSIPDPYRSTHIYAIRYSDECDKDTSSSSNSNSNSNSNSSDDERPVSSCGSSPLAGDRSPQKRTKSPPLTATTTKPLLFDPANPDTTTKLHPIVTPTPTIVAPTTGIVDDASCQNQDDEACSSVGGIFGWANMALPPKRDVLSWTTVSEKHSIYVVDVGLTPATCDALVTTTEQACKGRYASYTYAKQTLGCRDYPLLAREALGPIHSVVDAIMAKFEEKEQPELNTTATTIKPIPTTASEAPSGGDDATVSEKKDDDEPSEALQEPISEAPSGGDDATASEKKDDDEPSEALQEPISPSPSPTPPKQPQRVLQLDDREPHIVKYDVTKKERQKLDMHTDKSEWTFLIALSNGCGLDYDGGGTYFECLDATVHIQKGHALVFPGKLKHKGQAIHYGLRFLLVGFLVDKGDSAGDVVAASGLTEVACA